MFNHKQSALDGLFPGTTPIQIALLGWFGFKVEVIAVPVDRTVGGGARSADEGSVYYNVTVRVSYNGRSWETTKQMTDVKLKTLEKVIVKFRSITAVINTVLAKFRSVFSTKPTVTVKRK